MDPVPPKIPLPDAMPIMVLCGATHFPRSLMPLFIFEQRYRDMLTYALNGDRMFGVACARRDVDPESNPDPVHPVFTAGLIRACVKHPDGTSHLMLQGLQRVEIIGWDQVFPFRVASIIPVEDISLDAEAEQELAYELVALCQRKLEAEQNDIISAPMEKILEILKDPAEIADMVGHNFLTDPELRQELLEIFHVADRLSFLLDQIRTTL